MLTECPKCGFSQPEDQYCAQCGIDMRNYQPPRPSWKSRIFKHPLFPVLVFIPIAYGYFLYQQNQKEESLRQRMEYLTGTNPAREQPSPAAKADREPVSPPNESPASRRRTKEPEAPETIGTSEERAAEGFGFNRGQQQSALPPEATKQAETAAGSEAEKSPPPVVYKSPTISVIYAEASNDFLASLSVGEDGSTFKDYGEYAEQQVRRLQEKLNYGLQSGRVKVLERTSRNFQNLNSSLQWFSGARSSNRGPDIGVTTLLALNGQQNGKLFAELELLASVPRSADSSQILPEPYVSNFSLSPTRGYFITGMMLPRRRLAAAERETFNQGVLKIMLSEDFQAEETQFVVFVLLDSAASVAP